MNKYLKNTPFALSGVMLGTASLGNLLGNYSYAIHNILGIIAFIFWLVFVLKFLIHPRIMKKELENPGNFSIAPTFTMGSMVLVTYIVGYIPDLASVIWFLLIILQMFIMSFFTYYLVVKNFDFKNFIPGWFVSYVGTGIIPVTAPNLNHLLIGQIFLGFSLIMYAFLLPVMVYRIIKHDKLSKAIFPSIIIFAAPPSLCLTGYLNVYTSYSPFLVSILLILSLIMVLFAITNLYTIFKDKFYPSFAGLTFPFVISATAVTEVYTKAIENPVIYYIAAFETIFATIMVIIIIVLFLINIFNSSKHQF